MRTTLCALGALLLAAAAASADDSSAALAAGGVVFTKGTPVQMKAEDLYVSPKAVRIRFEFANDSNKDVDTLVAFPLPDIDTATYWGSPVGTVTDDPVNFVGFKAQVDGKPVSFKVEQRAFVKDKDVTALLAAIGLPINPVAGEGYQRYEKLPYEQRKRLFDVHAADGDAKDFVPQWIVRTKFYWLQHFPAHKILVVEHSYQPVTGQSFFGKSNLADKDSMDARNFCIDAPTKAKIVAMSNARLKAKADNGEYLNAYRTDYILKTANNWNGPIGRFHITLDKLKPDNVLSLCWDGALKKTGPATFEDARVNFTPTRDIHMLVLE